jgi:hypothetical protein
LAIPLRIESVVDTYLNEPQDMNLAKKVHLLLAPSNAKVLTIAGSFEICKNKAYLSLG